MFIRYEIWDLDSRVLTPYRLRIIHDIKRLAEDEKEM